MNQDQGPHLLTVPASAQGQRLDNFLLRHLKGVPRSLVYRLVRKGAIRVNGRRAKAENRISGGDEVRVPALDRPHEATAVGARTIHVPEGMLRTLRQSVIHEDDDYLVVDKPAGVAVHGGSGLAYGIIEAMRLLYPGETLELGHRLDRDTSGCLVLTKSRRGLTAFHDALRIGNVSKRYLALVAGRWEGPAQRCDLPISLERDETGRRQIRALEGHAIEGSAESARRATSLFAPIERFPGFTLMEVDIGTGRTHQIRVHGRALGHPVAGDHEHGDAGANRLARSLGLKRMFLHAQAIRFPDWQDDSLLFSAPLPADLEQVLQALSDQAP
nr:RluA family pseudouridine synthase [Thioalkalivibrio sp.]